MSKRRSTFTKNFFIFFQGKTGNVPEFEFDKF